MRILNFGSLNLDYVYQVPRFVGAGETLAAAKQQVFPGGKGLNQSIALARAGAQVYHAGVVGRGGEMLRNLLESSGVHGNYLEEQECLQGNAVIQVTPQGENCILLFGGSNQAVTPGQVERTVAQFGAGDWLVAQNEVSCLQEMICAAAGRGMRIALNPSPFDDALQDLPYGVMDWIFINEVEGKQMTGRAEPDAILETLRRRYPRLSVALTLGGEGALLATPERTIRQAAFPVKAVDTTAAGDTFTGFFLAALTGGLPLEECARRAAAASALAVTRPGASESIPMAAEVDAMLREAFAP